MTAIGPSGTGVPEPHDVAPVYTSNVTCAVEMSPFVSDRIEELKTWDDVKLLSVAVDRLKKWWRPGLLCIGDAAHAMSPIGGVGINMAVQDAVAAANMLARPLWDGTVTAATLSKVQHRRQFPTQLTQRLQIMLQNSIIGPALAQKG